MGTCDVLTQSGCQLLEQDLVCALALKVLKVALLPAGIIHILIASLLFSFGFLLLTCGFVLRQTRHESKIACSLQACGLKVKHET